MVVLIMLYLRLLVHCNAQWRDKQAVIRFVRRDMQDFFKDIFKFTETTSTADDVKVLHLTAVYKALDDGRHLFDDGIDDGKDGLFLRSVEFHLFRFIPADIVVA